ncbi:Cell division protein FtsW [hydrothermal vent metagenome]|uniref:peptidoglycan glycosyltransferase n=1 Tax=hydrothermal vent metagenome TaxID=652676 RepID=A0A3B0ZS29_9ZZZZ
MASVVMNNRSEAVTFNLDNTLMLTVLTLLAVGLVMMASASISISDERMGSPFHYLQRQSILIFIGLVVAALFFMVSLEHWERFSPLLLVIGFILLILVLIPGIGHEVNGSRRWLSLGFTNFQASELVKLLVIIFLAGYLVRRIDEVRHTMGGFIKPLVIFALLGALLMAEPDFGSTVVILGTALGMLFLAGVPLSRLIILFSIVAGLLAVLVVVEPYRMARMTSFMDPWADPFGNGFQLTQALIAFGRGEWFGVGLGESIQKLFYLPEAHTDFIFSVLSEELGFVGGAFVILLFGLLVWRAFRIGNLALLNGQPFGGYLAFGIGIWVGVQAFINIGVNMGVLPTKGLTLPLMSYGGSSIVVMCMAMALLQRVYHEAKQAELANYDKPASYDKGVVQ